jgi:thymidylate synthase ThyX
MSYAVEVLADSISMNVRCLSFLVTFPRFILAEVNTHRMLSRNSASSRAIPVERRIAQVRENPFVPEAFTVNRRGMQADAVLDDRDGSKARDAWLRARDAAVEQAERLVDFGVHKQHANRLLEPFCWHTAVMTATDWDNFFALRCHKNAQPEMQIIAKMMRDKMHDSEPVELKYGEWHLPFVDYVVFDSEGSPSNNPERALPIEQQLSISVARCAAVSYERQSVVKSIAEYAQRHDQMASLAHWSPFEHQAMCVHGHLWPPSYWGNFRHPWKQYRKSFEGERIFEAKD